MNLHEIYMAAQLAENNGSNADISVLKEKTEYLETLISNYHDAIIYGYHINPNESDSSAAVTYLSDAVGMTPAKMETDGFNYGSWKNAFFMPKPCMLRYDGTVAYYLDPNDYTKKIDGTPSDVGNPDFEGNAMMEWGHIWYKFSGGDEDGEGYFYVSNRQIDNSYHCWCNYNSKDEITPHFYTAIYNVTVHSDTYRSLSGVELMITKGCGNKTLKQEVNLCTNNNTTDDVEWYTGVYADRLLINALLVLIGKSLNTQATFGRGLDTGSSSAKIAYVTGNLNDKGLFYGVTANGNSGVKVFGMENWWGCVWLRTAGCISISNNCWIKLTYGTADGSTADGYNSTADGYISVGTTVSDSGYIKKFKYSEYGYMPCNIGGSSSTFYTDYFKQSSLWKTFYLVVGGCSDSELNAGAFALCLNIASNLDGDSISTSLSCKPVAHTSLSEEE